MKGLFWRYISKLVFYGKDVEGFALFYNEESEKYLKSIRNND